MPVVLPKAGHIELGFVKTLFQKGRENVIDLSYVRQAITKDSPDYPLHVPLENPL